jgi:uncharacterized protein YbjT (DUF2867 family)
MSKYNILVQGGCGHAGLQFVKSLMSGLKDDPTFSVRVGYTDYHEKNVPQCKELGVTECVKLDLNDLDTVTKALEGINCVVINPPYLPNREALCSRLIDKCIAAGVHHVFLISVSGAPTKAFPWAQHLHSIENKLISSGMKYTIIRTALYMESTLIQKQAIKEGSFFLPTADAKFPPVCVCDVGDLICKVAKSNYTLGVNTTLEITGPENLSGSDIARHFSNKLGKNVAFVSLNRDNFKEKLKSFGFQDYKVESITDYLDWYAKGNGRVSNEFSKVMGKDPKTFEQFLELRKDEILA